MIKKIIDLVINQLLKQFNLDKIKDYVEKPNELDNKVKKIESDIKKIKLLKNDIDALKNIVSKNGSIKDQLKKLKKVRF